MNKQEQELRKKSPIQIRNKKATMSIVVILRLSWTTAR